MLVPKDIIYVFAKKLNIGQSNTNGLKGKILMTPPISCCQFTCTLVAEVFPIERTT